MISAPDRIRTCDLRFRRPTLYPTELRARVRAMPPGLDCTKGRRGRAIGPFTAVILSFISSVFIPIDQLPSWLEDVGRVFPLFHLAEGLQTTFGSPPAPGWRPTTWPCSRCGRSAA